MYGESYPSYLRRVPLQRRNDNFGSFRNEIPVDKAGERGEKTERWKIDESKTPVERNGDFFVPFSFLRIHSPPSFQFPILVLFSLHLFLQLPRRCAKERVDGVLKEQYFHGICITGGIRLSNSQLSILLFVRLKFSPSSAENSVHRDESKSTGKITFLVYRFLLSLSLFLFFPLPSARNEGISSGLLSVEEASARVIAR